MKEKLKVLFLVEAMGGGVFTYIAELANELAKEFEMYVAYAVRRQTPGDFKDCFDRRVRLIEVKNFSRSIHPVKDARALLEMKRIARRVQPDIIHLHSSKAGILGRVAFNGRRTPLFYTPHGYSFLMLDHSKAKRFLYRMAEQLCAGRKCMTISCSEGEHRVTLELTKDAAYVNNGINTAELDSLAGGEAVKEGKSGLTVFTLGRICGQKNPALFNAVAEKLPEVHFLWIGDGELRPALTAPNIEVTGWIKRREALALSAKADVFLLTSLWEGLPMSLLEAMYLKKLCVVNNVIGNRDVIHNLENGYVCEKPEEFVRAILSAGSAAAAGMVAKAYKDVVNNYNTKVMARQYSAIYRLKTKSAAGRARLADIEKRRGFRHD